MRLALGLLFICTACETPPTTDGDAPANDGTLSLSASTITRDGDRAEIELEIRSVREAMSSRPGVELVTVLDTSESMTNRQMALARAFVGQLVQLLDPQDRFALIGLADEPTLAIESSTADDHAKSVWLERIQALEVGGLTDLSAAIERANDIASPEAIVILVSDGSPTWGVVADDGFDTEGREIWTVGVGRHNETLLRSIGRYFYLTDAAALADQMAPELFDGRTPVATGLTLTFSPPKDVEVLGLEAHVLDGQRVRTGMIFGGGARRFKVQYRGAVETDVGDVTLRYRAGEDDEVLRVVNVGRAAGSPELVSRDP